MNNIARAPIRRTAARPPSSHGRFVTFGFVGVTGGSSTMSVLGCPSRTCIGVSLSVDTPHLAYQVAELEEKALLSDIEHPVHDVVLALVGIFDRFEFLLIVALTRIDHGPVLRFGEPDV